MMAIATPLLECDPKSYGGDNTIIITILNSFSKGSIYAIGFVLTKIV
jgi:hypothetical protein